MSKSALIFDLDNTIYPVHSIAHKLFKSLFAHIGQSGEFKGNFEEIVTEIQRTPFEKVAEMFSFSQKLFNECVNLLVDLSYNEAMYFFEDYKIARRLPQRKFLVTSGFTKLQNSKIDRLKIRNDFEKIIIIDRQIVPLTKKDVFTLILKENKLSKKEVLIIGDDLSSEIQAGNELGIDTILYDRNGRYPRLKKQKTISDFSELVPIL